MRSLTTTATASVITWRHEHSTNGINIYKYFMSYQKSHHNYIGALSKKKKKKKKKKKGVIPLSMELFVESM